MMKEIAFDEPWGVLSKLAERPDAVELVRELRQLWQEVQAYEQLKADLASITSRSKLVYLALKVVKERGIVHPPFFQNRTDDEIRDFIVKYSNPKNPRF